MMVNRKLVSTISTRSVEGRSFAEDDNILCRTNTKLTPCLEEKVTLHPVKLVMDEHLPSSLFKRIT